MNQRETTPAPALGAGQALPCLALMLLPLLAVANARARLHFPAKTTTGQRGPYLPALGAPALRFQSLTPPPLLVARLAAALPSAPAGATPPKADASASPLSLPPSASDSTAPTPPESVADPVPPPSSTDSLALPNQPAPAADTPPESTHGPLPILPDDLRQPTRPEDFLPYFQLPGPGVNPGVPAPAPLPPSSATYTQTPR